MHVESPHPFQFLGPACGMGIPKWSTGPQDLQAAETGGDAQEYREGTSGRKHHVASMPS